MTARRRRPAAVAVAGIALTAAAVLLAAHGTGDTSALRVAVVAVSVGLPFAVAINVLTRYPDRVLGSLLAALGATYVLRALASSPDPAVYALGRAFGQSSYALLLWLVLAFPSGRLPDRASRVVVRTAALSVTVLWWSVIAFSPQIPVAGFFASCAPECPRNPLLIADAPGAAQVLELAFRGMGVLLVGMTAVLMTRRLVQASALMRRMVAPVLVVTLARAAEIVVVLIGPRALATELGVITYCCIPLSIALGLLLGRLYDAAALERLVRGLRVGPSPQTLRDVMVSALRDSTIDIAYWLPHAQTYVRADGHPTTLDRRPGRASTEISDDDDVPIALLEHDEALLDHPELLDAVATSTAVALQRNRLEAELAAARIGVTAALDTERQRIERDLHDGAQQRLIAIRMKLSVTTQLLDRDAARTRALLEELGTDVEHALAEVRSLARGATPPELVEAGLATAIAAIARDSPMPCAVEVAADLPRLDPAVESELYFVCREALQNAVKHGGPGRRATVSLERCRDAVRLEVRDNGGGFGAEPRATRGSGLANMRARAAHAGGSLDVEPAPDGGTIVRMTVPTGSPSAISVS